MPLKIQLKKKKKLQTPESYILSDLVDQNVKNAVKTQKQSSGNEDVHATLRLVGLKVYAKIKNPKFTNSFWTKICFIDGRGLRESYVANHN